jgi:hypothetical protein
MLQRIERIGRLGASQYTNAAARPVTDAAAFSGDDEEGPGARLETELRLADS